MATKLEIFNSTYIKLGLQPVTDTAASNKRNDTLNAVYDTIKAKQLREHPWNFAIKRAQLTVAPTIPSWKWYSAFSLPSDYLKVLQIRHDYVFAIENGSLVTEEGFATVTTDAAEAASTTTVINATNHEALVGDLITINSELRVVGSITTNSITLATALSGAPSDGDEFTIKRPSEIFIEYIADVDEADFTADFAECLAWILAAEICYSLIQSRELSNQTLEKAELMKKMSRSMDAQEGTPQELMDNRFINVRL